MSTPVGSGPTSLGIQTLLEAEKKALDIVQGARKQKTSMLKQAKEEAEMEIQHYKTEKEQEFQRYKESHLGFSGETSQKLEQETKQTMEAITTQVEQHKGKVIEMLLQWVEQVDISMHPNIEYYK
jgi:V-type H+-transporting ATPase subunit G